MSAGGGTKAIIAAFLANAGIAIAKFVAFLVTGSSSMLAESVHSTADAGNQGLLLLGGKLAVRDETEQHAFGYGRERYFWAFVVSLVLFSLGSMFAIYEAIHKIGDPHEIDSPAWAFGVLIIAIVLETLSFRTAINEANHVRGKASWTRFIRKSRSPELPVVLLEDLGALVGLILALAAVTIAVVFDAPVFDGIGTLCIGILLGIIAIILAYEMRSLLLGESATADNRNLITEAIESTAGVNRLIHMRTQHIGPDQILVAAKVDFDDDYDTHEIAEAINRTEKAIRNSVPVATHVYLEPDIYLPGTQTDKTR